MSQVYSPERLHKEVRQAGAGMILRHRGKGCDGGSREHSVSAGQRDFREPLRLET